MAITYCDSPERRVLDLAEAGLPEVPALGRTRYTHVIEPVAPHRHADCLEIGLCLRGALTLSSGSETHRVMPKSPYRTVGLATTCATLLLSVIEAAALKAAPPAEPRLEELVAAIKADPSKPLRLDDLAREARLSTSLLIAQFKHLTGLPPYHFHLACRLERGKQLLRSTDRSITEIALELGFCASQHFSGHFKRAFGLTPSQWRAQCTQTEGP